MINIVLTGQNLVEFPFIGSMGPLDLSVQSRGCGLDMGMAHPEFLDMPMEQGLKFVPVVGVDRMDPERKLFHYVIADSGCIIDGGVLEPLDRFACRFDEFQELDVGLDVVVRGLFPVSLRRDTSNWSVIRQLMHPVAPRYAVNASGGNLDVVISRQAPGDSLGAEVVLAPEMEDLPFDRDGSSSGQVAARPPFKGSWIPEATTATGDGRIMGWAVSFPSFP